MGTGPDLVLIHGWGGCSHLHMQPIAEHLSQHFTVHNIDLPGVGASDWAGQTSMREIADTVVAQMPERATYIGWSFGGAVAACVAGRYPERVERFIGLGTSPKFVADDNWPGIPQPGFQAGLDINSQEDVEAMKSGFLESEYRSFDPKPASYHQLAEVFNQVQPVDIAVLNQGIRIIDEADLRKAYRQMQCPVDLVFGRQDAAIPLAVIEHIAALNPNIKTHVLADAQHMPFWTHPDEFFVLLDSILKKN